MYVEAWGRQDEMRKEGVTVNADPDEVLRGAGALDHRRCGCVAPAGQLAMGQ
jgi:hypothetical protein